jgi:POT family proton-dependent oligopeptide transporter
MLDDSIVPADTLPIKIPHAPAKTTPSSPEGKAHTLEKVGSSKLTLQRSGQLATEDEIRDFLHVVDDIPARVWLATLVGVAERFTWYGNTGPLRMSMQNNSLVWLWSYWISHVDSVRVLSRELSPACP